MTADVGLGLEVGIDSEIGRLREVVVHRPGRELDRLTPGNVAELLFDDVMWASRARREHDEFVEVLVGYDVRVHLFADLLAQALATDAGRRFAVARVCTDERFGPTAARELGALFSDIDPALLVDYLVGGVLTSELATLSPSSVAWQSLGTDDFVLAPPMDFPAGSMAPKVEACMRFVAASGRSAAIGALRDAPAVFEGAAGTTITPSRSLA